MNASASPAVREPSTVYIDDSGDERRVVYTALVVPHVPTQLFVETVTATRELCDRIRGTIRPAVDLEWHGVDMVRGRTRCRRSPDTRIPQHRLDYLYQEVLHGVAQVPGVRVASVWADVPTSRVSPPGSSRQDRASRRSAARRAPVDGTHGSKVAVLWTLLDSLDGALAGLTDGASHRIVLDGTNNEADRNVVDRYALARGSRTGFLQRPILRSSARSKFLQIADLCAYGCFQTLDTTSKGVRAGGWYREHLRGKWLPIDGLNEQFGHREVTITGDTPLVAEARLHCLSA